MRILLSFLLCLLFANSANSEERSWTITQTAEGELVEVRGNLAYLRIQGNVESVPIERLSPADQQYLSSLRLKPILPGPAGNDSEALPMPTNGSNLQPSRGVELTGGEVGPAFYPPGEPTYNTRAMPPQNLNGSTTRRDPNVRPSSAYADGPGSRSLLVRPPNGENPNARRYGQQPQPPRNQANRDNKGKSSNENRGLLGRRRGDDR